MKKVIGMLALVALVGNVANAELLKNFKADGKIEVNAMSHNNELDANSDAKDRTSDADVRVQLNAGFDLTEDVNAVVSAVKCNRQYGNAAGESMENVTQQFIFEQAYMNLKGVLGFDHKLGRQYYGNEGDLVVYYGPRSFPFNWGGAANGLSVTGLDAYTGWYKTGKLDMHAIMAKITDAGSQPDTDTDLVGVVGKYDLMEEVKVGAYVYEKKDYSAAATPDLTLDVVGVKADGKFMGFDYSAELAKNYGRQAAGINWTGSAFKANVAYGIDLMGKLNFMGEFAMGSGDKTSADKDEEFTEINSDYRPGIIFGGVSGNTGLGNLTTYNVGAMWNPTKVEKLTLGAKYLHFAPTEEPAGYDVIGNELDLCATWKHSENVGLKAYYAMFMVNGDYADTVFAGKDDMATTLGAALTVKF